MQNKCTADSRWGTSTKWYEQFSVMYFIIMENEGKMHRFKSPSLKRILIFMTCLERTAKTSKWKLKVELFPGGFSPNWNWKSFFRLFEKERLKAIYQMPKQTWPNSTSHFRTKTFQSKSFTLSTPCQPQQGSDGPDKVSRVQMVSCQPEFKRIIFLEP